MILYGMITPYASIITFTITSKPIEPYQHQLIISKSIIDLQYCSNRLYLKYISTWYYNLVLKNVKYNYYASFL